MNNFFLVVMFIKSKLIKNKANRYLKLLTETIGLIVGIFILIFEIDNQSQIIDMMTRKTLGWVACGLILFGVGSNLIYMIFDFTLTFIGKKSTQ